LTLFSPPPPPPQPPPQRDVQRRPSSLRLFSVTVTVRSALAPTSLRPTTFVSLPLLEVGTPDDHPFLSSSPFVVVSSPCATFLEKHLLSPPSAFARTLWRVPPLRRRAQASDFFPPPGENSARQLIAERFDASSLPAEFFSLSSLFRLPLSPPLPERCRVTPAPENPPEPTRRGCTRRIDSS